MRTFEITISVVNGNIEYDVNITQSGRKKGKKVKPDPKHLPVNPGDKLRWSSDTNEFGIFFVGDDSPFQSGKTALVGAPSHPTRSLTIRDLASGEDSGHECHYCVAALDNNQLRTEDPDIIIDEI